MPRKKKIRHNAPETDTDDDHFIELGTAGRVVIPRAVRDELNWNEGVKLRVRTQRGRVVISTASGDLEYATDKLSKLSDTDV